MKRNILVSVAVGAGAIALWEFVRRVMQLPGLPGMTPRSREEIRTVIDLYAEFGDVLPDNVYRVFQVGVYYQLTGDYSAARNEYVKLRRLPGEDGKFFDLVLTSQALRHNWNLLPRPQPQAKSQSLSARVS